MVKEECNVFIKEDFLFMAGPHKIFWYNSKDEKEAYCTFPAKS